MDKRPTTFCCGCGLYWGLLTVATLYSAIMVHGALHGRPIQVLTVLFFLSPIAAIPVFPTSHALRTAAFLQQWLILILLIIALLASAVAMHTVDVSGYVCKVGRGE